MTVLMKGEKPQALEHLHQFRCGDGDMGNSLELFLGSSILSGVGAQSAASAVTSIVPLQHGSNHALLSFRDLSSRKTTAH